jgi:hypothetical protein
MTKEFDPTRATDPGDVSRTPEKLTISEMAERASELASRPEFAIVHNGESKAVLINPSEHPLLAEGKAGIDFTHTTYSSKKSPTIWTPASIEREWHLSEWKEGDNPKTGKPYKNRDFTSGLLQRYFNLIEGEAIRESGFAPVTSGSVKQLSVKAIWELMSPDMTPDECATRVSLVFAKYRALFMDTVADTDVAECADKFIDMIDAMRTETQLPTCMSLLAQRHGVES